MTTEQLAALKEVAEKTRAAYPNVKWFTVSDLQRSRVALSVVCSEHIAAFNPTTCLELLEEVERLTEHLANVEHDFKSTLKHCDDHHVEGREP